MPTVVVDNPSSALPATAELRQELDKTLGTDTQLEAFCIDYFPQIHRQFSSGMERTRKLNLLLSATEPAVLRVYLNAHKSRVAGTAQTMAPRTQSPALGPVRRRWLGIALGLASACVAGLAALHRSPAWLHSYRGAGGTQARSQGIPAPIPGEPGAAEPIVWLLSDPPAAVVVAEPSGLVLGQTPWAPEGAALWGVSSLRSLRVSLRMPGFVPVIVTLDARTERDRSRPLLVRLPREPRAAAQRDHGQEARNVPTQIIP